MKNLASYFLLTLALTLGFATGSFGQAIPAATQTTLETTFTPYIEGAVTTRDPAPENFMIGIGAERDTNHFYLDGSGLYATELITANPGAGHVGAFQLQGYYKLFGHVLVGGGATTYVDTGAFRTPNHKWINNAKAAANPIVGLGLEYNRFRSIATYQLQVRGEGVPEQIKFALNSEYAFTRHLRLTVPLIIDSYRVSDPYAPGATAYAARRLTNTQIGVGIKIVFGGARHVTAVTPTPAPIVETPAPAPAPAPAPVVVETPAPTPAPAPAPVVVAIPTPKPVVTEVEFDNGMRDIFFDYNKSNIRADQQATLEANIAFLRAHPTVTFLIVSSCDVRGTETYNLTLGKNRVETVHAALAAADVDGVRMTDATTVGKTSTYCSKSGESCFQQNRRVHFKFAGNN